MLEYAVLSAVGPDRPGIVADLTAILQEKKANIEDSRMSVLGGDFALILLFSAKQEDMPDILDAADLIQRQTGLAVYLRSTVPPAAHGKPSLTWRVKAVTLDHPGIIHGLAEIIAGLGINIMELKSHTAQAPVSGTPVFSMDMRLDVPAEQKTTKLKDALIRFGNKENIDIDIHIES